MEIEKYYRTRNNRKKALDQVSFSVNLGDFVSMMGASGFGKTTLSNCISTIDSVSSGHIYWGEQDLITIEENIYLPLIRHIRRSAIFAGMPGGLITEITWIVGE